VLDADGAEISSCGCAVGTKRRVNGILDATNFASYAIGKLRRG